ncbi:type VI secretion system Vgr family protein [Acanthopleuribacter pedis]|uniref:Type VI secretion system tip protein VgrG n=1 Tax=Acanthopleuribacter pedis TaxID=442870 RepID=A0A8J7QK39_9BACT|nr:type VI secretion system tip protein TssI/VgrG [Acanthopleuribacter pedis]MBO1321455.1 type VI secretion system tip protein VgrG [Acanthopleuribacter pedis]
MTAEQNNRSDLFWRSPGSDIAILEMEVSEAISELYSLRVKIVSADPGLAFKDMLNKDAKIELMCGDDLTESRFFSGIITRFGQGRTRFGHHDPSSDKEYIYEVEIRPKLWLLTRRTKSRVYQKMSAEDITKEVLGEHGISNIWSLNGSPSIRDYCVQYQESDYQFICRLLEEEGICFVFDQENSQTLFCNKISGHPACKPRADAYYNEEPTPELAQGTKEAIMDFTYHQSIGTGRFNLQHYNYETSQLDLKVVKEDKNVPLFTNLEHYDHTRNYRDTGEGNTYAGFAKEASAANNRRGYGTATHRSFAAGHTVTIENHFNSAFNAKWLIVSCDIKMEQGHTTNRFSVMPCEVPFRPERKTPWPRVQGTQTATVTGPSGAKVYLDQLGRAKLQFHWDREGQKNDRSSMWVRVSNNYAGPNYGIQWIPRIGHEVIVSFIEGNPDLPLITGRVYNDANPPPLGPAEKWQNIIKTIKDNHIMFDDKDGAELLDIRAERDMNTVVIRNDTQDIGDNRTIKVGRNHNETIGKDMVITVEGNLTEKVKKDYSEDVTENYRISVGKKMETTVGTDRNVTVGKNETVVIQGKADREIKKTLTETVDKDISISGKKNYSLDIKDKANISVGKDINISGNKKGNIDIADKLTITVGSAKMVLKKNGNVEVNGKKIQVKGSSDIVIKGSKIGLN